MTAQTRATLKSKFEQGDTPQGSDYGDLIDSFLSLVDSTAQNIDSAVTFSGTVSFNGQVSAASLVTERITVTTVDATRLDVSSVSAATVSANVVRAATVSALTAHVSAFTAVTANISGLSVLGSLNLEIETTASATGGTGQTMPTSVAGWIAVSIAGSPRRIPFFPVS